MKKILITLFLVRSICAYTQTEDWYGNAKISFHGIICNRTTNDDPLGMDGVGDEVTPDFWVWSPITNNRASYGGMQRVYGEDFLLPNRIKAGTATINGGFKAGDSYYRPGSENENNLLILGNHDIVNTFCSNSTLIAIFPALFERDEGPLHTSPFQDLYIKVRQAFQNGDIQQAIQDFAMTYTYNDSNPYGFFLAGRHIGLDAMFTGMFSPNKNKLASRPIGLFSNWDLSSQLIVLTPKTIKIIAEKDYGYGKGILPVHFNEESMGNTIGHGNYIVLLRVVADIKDRNAGNPVNTPRTITMKVKNMKPGDEFKYRLWVFPNADTLTVRYPDSTLNFSLKPARSSQYYVKQVSGPRSCGLLNAQGVVIDNDVVVTANCYTTPTNQRIGIKLKTIGDGEKFEFTAGQNKVIGITEAGTIVYFPGTFPAGSNYTITQLSGMRTCSFTPAYSGVVGNQDIIIEADCGEAPVKRKLKGKLTAPKGTSVTLKLNNKEILKLVQNSKEPGDPGTIEFEFPTPLAIGSQYIVSLQTTPGSNPCVIYENGEGMMDENIVVGIRSDRGVDLISRSTDNKVINTYYESYTPVPGGKQENEGRYVAFAAYGKGMDGSSGNYRQIYWRDRKTGITKMISKNAAGEEGNQNSYYPAISADGLTVAFESFASNLTGEDNNKVRDVFAWNERSGLQLISKAEGGGTANGESYEPTVSGDGSVIAYTSYASNIVTLNPVFSTPNIYINNGGSTIFITKDFESGKAVSGYAPSISEDGTKVAFCSFSSRLVKGDNNNLWDIFLWNGSSMLKRISMTASGGERNQGNESSSRVVWPAISGDGNWVAFATTASNMVPGDDNNMQDVFICHSEGGGVRKISQGNGDSPISQGDRVGISYDGQWVSYQTNADNMGVPKGNIVLQNTRTGKLIPITSFTSGSSARPMLSRTGGYVAAGCSEKYDKRFPSSGLFVFYTGL